MTEKTEEELDQEVAAILAAEGEERTKLMRKFLLESRERYRKGFDMQERFLADMSTLTSALVEEQVG